MTRALFFLFVTACAAAHSSRDVLTLAQSRSTLNAGPVDAAREVTRLFATRGYALVDQQPTADGRRLEFWGRTPGHNAEGFGSTFYAWILADGSSAIVTLVGWTTIDGRPVCEVADRAITCDRISNPSADGQREAIVVHGVLSELAVEGVALAAPGIGAIGHPAGH